MRRSLTLLLLVVVALVVPARRARAADPSFDDLAKRFKAALSSEDPVVRARAFGLLYDTRDPQVVALIVKSVRTIRGQQEKIRRDQDKVEAAYETQFEKKLKADRWFENSTRSGKDLDRYNRGVKKIARKLDALMLRLKSLENDFTRTRAQLDGAVMAMGKVLDNVPTESFAAALQKATSSWLDGGDTDDRIRWVQALTDVKRPIVSERLRAAAANPELDAKVRAAALRGLADRKDPAAHDLAVRLLEGEAAWDLQAAAIQALKRLHEKRSIAPLIAFLGRKDIKRLREDAHAALKSLTGQKHGPYQDPWQRWWTDHEKTFRMPDKPVKPDQGGEVPEGVTFYGIHTFSDRVLFILDISGSMDQQPTAKDENGRTIPTGPPKIETAKKELVGAINNLGEGARFNVIFFNHEVVPWQSRMVEATESVKRRAIKWVEDQKPIGTTNIHDALEAAFSIALKATGAPLVDTIFFLTDGTPTSGKIQDPERILRAVEEWERAAPIKINTIGVGRCAEDLLRRLAEMTGGEFRIRR
ncbi:MAG: HEAT repeat domain-containing protein [Planctomycetota bacterium]